MRDHFVLKPPAERKEGESTGSRARTMPAANLTMPAVSAGKLKIKIPPCAKNSATLPGSDTDLGPSIESDPTANVEISDNVPQKEYPSLLTVISESLEGIDLQKELKGKFTDDPLFKIILDKP